MKQVFLAVGVVGILAACAAPATGPSAFTSGSATSGTVPGAVASLQSFNGRYSCPDGDAIQVVGPVSVMSGGSAQITIRAVSNVHVYITEVYRRNVRNVFEPVITVTTEDWQEGLRTVRIDLPAPKVDGTYIARVRYRNACQGFGPWTDWLMFGVDGREDDPVSEAHQED